MQFQSRAPQLTAWFLVGVLLALSVVGCERNAGNRDTDELKVPRVLYLEKMKAIELRERPAFTEAEREQMREEETSRIFPIAQRHVALIVGQPNYYHINIGLLCYENGDSLKRWASRYGSARRSRMKICRKLTGCRQPWRESRSNS